MGLFGRVVNLVKGSVRVATKGSGSDAAAREAALEAELRAGRPAVAPTSPTSPTRSPVEPKSPAPPDRDADGNVRRRL